MIGTWNAPAPGAGLTTELLVSLDADRDTRILVLPAWFEEANKLRRFTIEVMRLFDIAGIDSFLPDLPGCNESLSPLSQQTVRGWRDAAQSAAEQMRATHVLAIRGGALIAPAMLPGWQYAPETGARQVKTMLRAQVIALREKGVQASTEALQEDGRRDGLMLAGWEIGPQMFHDLEAAQSPPCIDGQMVIPASSLDGRPLWLRAEPSHDPAQAHALAALIREKIAST